jgi:hypothetical protein
MATPFLAGSSALLFSVKGKSATVGRTARTLFESTAQPISSSLTDGDPFQTVTQQGAGLVQVFDALFTTTIISPAELILNDTANFAGPYAAHLLDEPFLILSLQAKVHRPEHWQDGPDLHPQPRPCRNCCYGHCGGVRSFYREHILMHLQGTIFASLGPVPLSTDFATVTFKKAKFTLSPGGTQEVIATITPPKGVDATTFPVYSGFIHVTSGTDSVHATYLGLAASLKDFQVVDNTDFLFGVDLPLIIDSAGNIQDAPVNYTFVGDDAPTVFWSQTFGTAVLRLDLVSSTISLTGTLNTRSHGPPSISFPNSHKGGTFAKVPISGTLLELDYISRNDQVTLIFLVQLA